MRSLLIAVLLLAAPVAAQDRDDAPEAAATEAARVIDEFCVSTAAADAPPRRPLLPPLALAVVPTADGPVAALSVRW